MDTEDSDRLEQHRKTVEALGLRLAGDAAPVVRLPGAGGFFVRRHFVRQIIRQLPDHLPVRITTAVTVSADGRALVHSMTIDSLEPLDDAQFIDLGFPGGIEARDRSVQIEAQEVTPDRGYSPDDADPDLGADVEAAYAAVRAPRRRRQVTPELLSEVLALYDQGGIQAVMAAKNYSESYSFKLLRRARAEVAS